jgi:hypothetical protein
LRKFQSLYLSLSLSCALLPHHPLYKDETLNFHRAISAFVALLSLSSTIQRWNPKLPPLYLLFYHTTPPSSIVRSHQLLPLFLVRILNFSLSRFYFFPVISFKESKCWIWFKHLKIDCVKLCSVLHQIYCSLWNINNSILVGFIVSVIQRM